MEIHFGLAFSPNAYVDMAAHGGICLDQTVVGPEGLVSLLELHMGLHHEERTTSDRQAAYYAALGQAMKEGGDNVFTKSWEQNGLAVSNACLKWRDALRLAGWCPEMKQPSERLRVMALAEKAFDEPSLGDRVERILTGLGYKGRQPHAQAAATASPLPAGSCIHVAAMSPEGLHPALADLLAALAETGVEVVYEQPEVRAPKGTNLARLQRLLFTGETADGLREGDDSLRLWQFETALDAARYVASLPADAEALFVTADGKLLDNVQRMLRQPTSGSSLHDAHPQIIQLFKLGLSLFDYPFNIRNLIAWLLMPVHPLKSLVRRPLASAVIETGGYRNEACREALDKVRERIAAEAPDADHRDKALRELDEKLSIFIPDPQPEGVDRHSLLVFVKALATWSGQMANFDGYPDIERAQLARLSTLCQSLVSVIETEAEGTTIPYSTLEGWTSALYNGTDLAVYETEAGARPTAACGDIAEAPRRVVWTDCYNYEPAQLATDFLNQGERSALAAEGCRLWDERAFNRAMMLTAVRPALMAREQLTLVTVRQADGEAAAKHPLVIRLEQAFSDTMARITESPANSRAEDCPVTPNRNYSAETELHFSRTDLVRMRGRESYTSLDLLVQYPIDYVLGYLLNVRDYTPSEMPDIATVKGNVAHAVIEALFTGGADEIEQNIKARFGETLQHVTEEKGAILLLKENVIEYRLFTDQLRESLDSLAEIIRDNGLTVVGREHEVANRLGLATAEADDPEIKGFVDMTLRNASGDLFVFDFKWTSSKTYHRGLLEQNASIQLALYEELMNREAPGQRVVATAYFTMPRHKLYTTSAAIADGPDVEHVTPANADDLMDKIRHSYRYRRDQLLKGIVENGEGRKLDDIRYAQDQDAKGLVPLTPGYDKKKDEHAVNSYSDYAVFKDPQLGGK